MAKHLFELLKETAARAPLVPAYTWPEGGFCYADLERMARSVGTCVATNADPLRAVAILMDARSAYCVPVMMGVLAAGCFYAPLDPNLPEDRLRLILDNLRPEMIIADEKAIGKGKNVYPGALCIDAAEALATPPDDTLIAWRCAKILPEDLAAVMYTSGSTGVPKGVAHTQKALVAWTQTTIDKYKLNERDILANQSPWYYANCLLELFVPIQLGARVAMIPPSFLTFPKRLIRYLKEEKITELCMTPSSFVAVANSGILDENLLPDLRMFIMSGEVMPVQQLKQWMDAAPSARAMNFYGSTETLSVAVTDAELPKEGGVIPVGKPLPNVKIRLMREDGTEAAEGETGELYVQSPMITVGYYRDEARTAASLVPDPLGQTEKKWFRTGDFGMLKNGSLSVLGRKDSMIKHHGYRMELGEVEAAVRSLPGCREACCLYQKEKDEIWCFLAGALQEAEVHAGLKARLAKYMLPDHYVILEELPHNANAKIDRNALQRRILD